MISIARYLWTRTEVPSLTVRLGSESEVTVRLSTDAVTIRTAPDEIWLRPGG